MNQYFTKAMSNGILTQKSFQKTIAILLTNKGIVLRNEISLFDGEKRVNNESKAEHILNVSYINVIKKCLGIKPIIISDQGNTDLFKDIDIIVEKYSSHLTVKEIKKNIKHFNPFSLQRVSNSNA